MLIGINAFRLLNFASNPKRSPTKRAPDAGDSAHIPGSFLRLIIFLVGRLRRPHPSAGNANRWVLAHKHLGYLTINAKQRKSFA